MPLAQLQIDAASFLKRYWQREHLFIPAGIKPFDEPVDADELAGLAMEDDVDSRIVLRAGEHWQQIRGPFVAADYERAEPWTLLVQSVDRYWDEAAELLQAVGWLPGWRRDDIMMSYATDGGSAGPHYDNYDVFIIQGRGQRRWQIGQFCDASSALRDDTNLRLLATFEPRNEYLMNSGDVLYVPPGCAHFGESIGESTSFSIGFRAPRLSDLLARWTDNHLQTLDDDQLFSDAGREPASRIGEISTADVMRARDQLRAIIDREDPRWFGEAVTDGGASAAGTMPSPDNEDLETLGCLVTRAPDARLAWFDNGSDILVFTQGLSRDAPSALAELLQTLCADRSVRLADALELHDGARDLLHWLHEEGSVLIHDD